MPHNQTISLILLLILLVTLAKLYYFGDDAFAVAAVHPYGRIRRWFERAVHPIRKSVCPLRGFKCPSDDDNNERHCDCDEFCHNGSEYVPFHVVRGESIYVMNEKLQPGTYCLPKGVEDCNLNVNRHVFSLAGWSCLPFDEVVFKGDKKRACKNDEALDNGLNVLWDRKNDAEASDVDDYYESLESGDLRYGCRCGSKSIDGTPMISVFPFVCSIDYCLRDVAHPLHFMGWTGEKCACGPYSHLIADDEKSPCMTRVSTASDDNTFTGRVDCMDENSFVRQSLFCPTATEKVLFFKEYFREGSEDLNQFVQDLMQSKKI